MRKIILAFALLASMSLPAQDFKVVRGDCTPYVGDGESVTTRGGVVRRAILPDIIAEWNPNRVYRQLVILVAFKGDSTYFNRENPRETYNRMLNEGGYNERDGKGCMADYFRDQSNGLLNLQFDVYGPYAINQKAQPYDNPTDNTRNYGTQAMIDATQMMIGENPELDFSVYDWNGNGYVNQVIYVFAGISGNTGASSYGYLWPNTSSFATITTPCGVRISNYTASAECWPTKDKASCGIGTICHEFTHSLGLPDIYPTGGNDFSVVDEWDLMDGGNFTNMGWCPPNYTALEKMLLGWLTPVEIDSPATIIDMKPISEGGETYIIHHTATEYLLLENHQWTGWDAGLPGKGLLITHVNYDSLSWRGNRVNSDDTRQRYSVVHADNLDYDQWDLIAPRSSYCYANDYCMNNRHLSTSPYPWSTDSTTTVVDALVNLQMFNSDATGSRVLRKPITNIQTTDDGLVSFYFMGGDPVAVKDVPALPSAQRPSPLFDLQGRRVVGEPGRGLYIRNGKKILIK